MFNLFKTYLRGRLVMALPQNLLTDLSNVDATAVATQAAATASQAAAATAAQAVTDASTAQNAYTAAKQQFLTDFNAAYPG